MMSLISEHLWDVPIIVVKQTDIMRAQPIVPQTEHKDPHVAHISP